MLQFMINFPRAFAGRFGLALLLVALCLTSARVQAQSSTGGNIAYDFSISEDLNVLAQPLNTNLGRSAGRQNSNRLMAARNMPYITIKNTSDVAFLNSFSMTIGDTLANFDYARLVKASSGVTMSVDTSHGNSADNIPNGQKGDNLFLNFTGLAPGESITFQVDIDADAGQPAKMFDYRQTFFKINGGNATPSLSPGLAPLALSDTQNSELKFNFSSGSLTGTMTKELEDYTTSSPVYTGTTIRGACAADFVQPFGGGDTAVLGEMVPEPGSIVLLGLGAAGFALLARRKARR